MNDVAFDVELDVRGLSCPMPIVKARLELKKMEAGQVLKVMATDRGSLRDFQGWAKASKEVELVGQETAEQDGKALFLHYVRKTG